MKGHSVSQICVPLRQPHSTLLMSFLLSRCSSVEQNINILGKISVEKSNLHSRPDYWSGEPFPSPRDLPNPGTEPGSPSLQVDSLPAEPQGKPSMGVYQDS